MRTARTTAQTNPAARTECPYCAYSEPLLGAARVEPPPRWRKRKAARGWSDIPP